MSPRSDRSGAPPDPIRPAPRALQPGLFPDAPTGSEPLAPADWERLLSAELGAPVRVRYGRARRSVVRAARRGGVHVVHLSGFFAQAPAEVRAALAGWLRSGRRARRACQQLDAWIAAQVASLEPRPARAAALRTRGAHHDLEALAQGLLARELRADFSSERPAPAVTWGRAGRSRSRRSLRLGSFDFHARLVRIHPVLDQAAVPQLFVRYVLFHELLHAALGEDTIEGRRVHHGPVFRARERQYADHAAALEWERAWIRALIRSAKSGEALKGPDSPRGVAARRSVTA